jgi:hypothetical protein
MNFFWVNLGTSLNEVLKYNFLWAPQYTLNEKGTKIVNAGWSAVAKVRKGDVIFCYCDGEISCLAKATNDVDEADRPESRTFNKWKQQGWKIDVTLTAFSQPIRADEFKEFFIENYNSLCTPKVFTSKGQCSQFYMSTIPAAAGALILSYCQDTASIVDVVSAESPTTPMVTEREAIIKSRIGQGPYRKKLIEIWHGKCSATDLAYEELLVASHIVPWALSDSSERIDPYNGFLLSPNIDKLFDRGLISFTDEGKLLRSESITDEILAKLGIAKSLKIAAVKKQNLPYLARHRELFKFTG